MQRCTRRQPQLDQLEPSHRRPDLVETCPQVPVQWMQYILAKGFIAVDGCSLTVSVFDAAHEAG